MHRIANTLGAAVLTVVLPAAVAAQTASGGAQGLTAKADLKDAKGRSIGQAQLSESPNGVLVRVSLKGAPAGEHAFHIHETGKCEPPFKTAGGHFNPAKKQHGFLNPQGAHGGDLPNINVPSSGQLDFEFFAHGVTLGAGSNSLLDQDGSALVLHAKPDDYRSDPAGNAGDRVACGVVQK